MRWRFFHFRYFGLTHCDRITATVHGRDDLVLFSYFKVLIRNSLCAEGGGCVSQQENRDESLINFVSKKGILQKLNLEM